MRLFWKLPRLAPLLLRQIGAYVELAALDLAQWQRYLAEGLVLAVLIGMSVFFALLMGCVIVLALTWDGPHRVTAIAWMAGGFLAIACLAIWYGSSWVRQRPEFLDTVRRQWHQDAVLFEKLLADEEGHESQG